MITVTPEAATRRISATPALASDGVRPVSTSSSSSRRGPVASARATSRRRFSGGVSSPATASARWVSSTRSKVSRAARRAAAAVAWRASAPTVTFSTTFIESNERGTWKVRAMPRRQRSAGGSPVMSAPSNRMRPLFGR